LSLNTGSSIWCATISWFVPQNQASNGLSIVPQNQRECDGVRYALRSSDLLHMKACRASFSQSGLKTGGGTTASVARGTIVEVTSRST
jgi:hypothetical protein